MTGALPKIRHTGTSLVDAHACLPKKHQHSRKKHNTKQLYNTGRQNKIVPKDTNMIKMDMKGKHALLCKSASDKSDTCRNWGPFACRELCNLPSSCALNRVGQNRIYVTVYLVVSLPKLPYIHHIYMLLANPSAEAFLV